MILTCAEDLSDNDFETRPETHKHRQKKLWIISTHDSTFSSSLSDFPSSCTPMGSDSYDQEVAELSIPIDVKRCFSIVHRLLAPLYGSNQLRHALLFPNSFLYNHWILLPLSEFLLSCPWPLVTFVHCVTLSQRLSHR